jgi:hypothetical protein
MVHLCADFLYRGLQQSMSVLLTQTILAARSSQGDDTIWVQMLVLVILAVFIGIISIAKAKANKLKEEDPRQYQQKPVVKTFKDSAGKREKDLQSGMELLGLDFLLSIVENTNGDDDEKDVAMRKLNFKELLRRGKLNQADSKALKVYAINKGNLYGKDIQCEAIKALAERTVKGKRSEN